MLKHATWITNAKARLVAADLCDGNVDDDPEKPATDAEFPYAQIAIGGDTAKPDGDPRTGEVKFTHETTLAVMAVDTANTGPELKTKLAGHAQTIFEALCPEILVWAVNAEGIDSVNTTYELPPDGAQIVGRVIVAFQILSRSHWPLPDEASDTLSDLTHITIDLGNGIGADITIPTE